MLNLFNTFRYGHCEQALMKLGAAPKVLHKVPSIDNNNTEQVS